MIPPLRVQRVAPIPAGIYLCRGNPRGVHPDPAHLGRHQAKQVSLQLEFLNPKPETPKPRTLTPNLTP